MSSDNLGNQYITFDYKHPAKGSDFNTLLRDGIKPGVYSGGLITPSGGVEVSIAPFIIYINTGDNELCRIETRSAVTLSITEATPVIALTYTWADVSENWLDFNQRASGSSPLTNEIVLGECEFAGGVITGINYDDKTWGIQYDGTVNPDFNADQVDGCDVEATLSPTLNTRIPTSKAVADYYYSHLVVGSSIKTESEYIAISPEHPWLCLSLSDRTLNPANYPIEFIDKLRARKYIYNEFNDPMLSPKAESFSGAWDSNRFTLANTPENVAMITELAEDWLFAGSPSSNWRILSDGVTEFNITGINVTSRTITVNLDGVPATGTSIIIYTNRVYRDATKARHFSEAGLATYQAGGGKSGRLFRRDQMQGHYHSGTNLTHVVRAAEGGVPSGHALGVADTSWTITIKGPTTDGTNGTPRTGSETIAKSSSRYEYIYVGSYTA